MAQSAFRNSLAQAVVKRVPQISHGFEVGEVVVFDGTEYVFSLADSEINSAGSLMVSKIVDVDTFEITACGYVDNLTAQDPYIAGQRYWLSPTNPGQLTTVKPTTVGQVELECFFATSTTDGWFFGGAGQLVAGSTLPTVVVTGNTVMVPNTIYRCNAVAQLDMTLPAAMAVDDVIRIESMNTGGFILKQNASQSTHLTGSGLTSSVGVGGSIQLNNVMGVKSGNLNIKCTTANTGFRTYDGSGDYTVA